MARTTTKGLDVGYLLSVKDQHGQVALRRAGHTARGPRLELVTQSMLMANGTVYFGYIRDARALRLLAETILKEVPAPKKRARK